MIVAFTGHRPDKLGGYPSPTRPHDTTPMQRAVVSALRERLVMLPRARPGSPSPTLAISGMALGVDQ